MKVFFSHDALCISLCIVLYLYNQSLATYYIINLATHKNFLYQNREMQPFLTGVFN